MNRNLKNQNRNVKILMNNLLWYDYIGIGLILNWGVCIAISWLYVLWLLLISKDIKFEGWITVFRFIPVARFRLISRKSWYAKLWDKFYGFGGLFLAMIHRDEPGEFDNSYVEKTIVHELRHVFQVLALGTLFWITFGIFWICIKLFTNKHPYIDNPYEIDARKYANEWVMMGCLKIYNFGDRN